MLKKEIKRYESLEKWFNKKLAPWVFDVETSVLYDGEDPGFIGVITTIDDDLWEIGFTTSSGDTYIIADAFDCEDMSIKDIKDDIIQRVEVMKIINWSGKNEKI